MKHFLFLFGGYVKNSTKYIFRVQTTNINVGVRRQVCWLMMDTVDEQIQIKDLFSFSPGTPQLMPLFHQHWLSTPQITRVKSSWRDIKLTICVPVDKRAGSLHHNHSPNFSLCSCLWGLEAFLPLSFFTVNPPEAERPTTIDIYHPTVHMKSFGTGAELANIPSNNSQQSNTDEVLSTLAMNPTQKQARGLGFLSKHIKAFQKNCLYVLQSVERSEGIM